ncbi:SprT-like protease [Mycobacterium phage ScoobyDoobyDoo]|nr:SprT-like protease [Mycobacterium phage ScoobyDoobyDoo]
MSNAHMTPAQARRITENLLADHGLHGWRVTFGTARTRNGSCSYSTRTINLSRTLMAFRSYEETLNTITHEVAHALTPGHQHDRVWAAKHRELGGTGERCSGIADEARREALTQSALWVGTCDHGKNFPRHRQPKRLDGWRCRCVAGGSPVVWRKTR